MEITIRASWRLCPVLHWHVKIYASTPENVIPSLISRKLFAKSIIFFKLFFNSNSTNMNVVILLALFCSYRYRFSVSKSEQTSRVIVVRPFANYFLTSYKGYYHHHRIRISQMAFSPWPHWPPYH